MATIPLPGFVTPESVTLKHEIPTWTTTSLNRKRRSRDRGIHILSGSFDLTVDNIADQKALEAWFVKMRGRGNEFELVLPWRFASENITGNPQTTVAANIGTTAVSVSGFAGTIQAGSIVNFLNDDKAYIVEDDVTSGAVMRFYPPLQTTQLINSAVQARSPSVLCALSEDMQEFTYTENGLHTTYTIDWTEAL